MARSSRAHPSSSGKYVGLILVLSLVVVVQASIGTGDVADNQIVDSEKIASTEVDVNATTPVSMNPDDDQDDDVVEECRTPECLYLSKRFRSAMNLEVDPCDNFYEYACGHYNPLSDPPLESSVLKLIAELFSEIPTEKFEFTSRGERLAHEFFLSCMDRDAIEKAEIKPFLDFLKEMGGWGESFNASQWTLQNTLETAHLYQQNLLFSWYLQDDQMNSSRLAIMLRPTSLNMSTLLEAHLRQGQELDDALNATLADMLPLIPLETDLSPVVELDRRLRQIGPPESVYEFTTSRLSIAELQKEAPFLDWLKFFNSAFSEVNITLYSEAEICILDIEYFQSLSNLMSEYTKTAEGRGTLANYLNFQMLYDFSKLQLSLGNGIRADTLDRDEIERTCMRQTWSMFTVALDAVYIRGFVDKSSIDLLVPLAEAVKTSFREIVQAADWLDERSHDATIEKAHQVMLTLGYEKWLLDSDSVDSEYDDLDFEEDGFFGKYLEVRQFLRRQSCNKYDELIDRNSGKFSSIGEVNALYDLSRNMAIVTAAFARPPRYNMFYPRYAQFGVIGATIGHELFHSLDNIGLLYDENGNVRQWWEDSTIQRFNERAQCFIDQYGAFGTPGMQLDGQKTLGENLDDLGGLAASFNAYKSWRLTGFDHPRLPELNLDHEQLFFLSYAHSFCSKFGRYELRDQITNTMHTPHEFRVIGTLRNLPEFAEVFSCSNSTKMNPVEKCVMW